MRRLFLLALSVLIGGNSTVFANESKLLEEIVVTATRSEKLLKDNPYSVSSISEDELRFAIEDQLADSLRKLPGLLVTDAGQAGQKRIRIRGEEARRVALLIDGQEFIDHREVGVPLLADVNRIHRIEVVRGPASVLYGPKAMGGVVNIITRPGDASDIAYRIDTSFNSATSGHTAHARVHGQLGPVQLDLSASVNDQGDRDTPAGEIENTSYHSSALNGSIGWNWDAHQLYIGFDDFQSDSEVFVEDEIRFSAPFRDFVIDAPRRDRRKYRADYQYLAAGDVLSSVKLDIYHQVSDREFNTFPMMTLAPGLNVDTSILTTSDLVSDGFNLQVDLFSGSQLALITGIQWLRDDVDQHRLRFVETNGIETSREIQTDQAELETSAVYIQAEYDLTDQLAFYAGLRSYDVDGELSNSSHGPAGTDFNDNHTVAGFAAVYSLDRHTLRLNHSEGYIYPSLFNLVIGAYAGSSYINPVTDLKPETSNTTEIGYRFAAENWSLDATLFQTRAKNYIDHLPCLPTDGCPGRRDRIYKNIGKANSHGLELGLNYRMNSIAWSMSLTWLQREKIYEGVDTWDAGVPQLTGYIAAEHEGAFRNQPLVSRIIARFESDTDELVATRRGSRLDHNAGYGVVDLEFFYQASDKLNIGLIAANIGDKKYHSATENLWAAGRHARVKFSLDL